MGIEKMMLFVATGLLAAPTFAETPWNIWEPLDEPRTSLHHAFHLMSNHTSIGVFDDALLNASGDPSQKLLEPDPLDDNEDFFFSDGRRKGRVTGAASVGFTAGPGSLLLGGEVTWFFTQNIGIGPLVQMGVGDDVFFIAPTANVRGVLDLGREGFLRRVKPFVEGGAGIIFMTREDAGRRGRGEDEDLGLLLNIGGGLDVHLSNHISLGTHLLFNVMPVEVGDENFFFAWHFAVLRVYF